MVVDLAHVGQHCRKLDSLDLTDACSFIGRCSMPYCLNFIFISSMMLGTQKHGPKLDALDRTDACSFAGFFAASGSQVAPGCVAACFDATCSAPYRPWPAVACAESLATHRCHP